VKLAHDVTGQGPVLVLLHAFPFARSFWDDNLAALAANHRVVRVELAGARSIAQWADDVVEVLDGLGVPLAAVLGLSMGGYVALAIAAKNAVRLSALILCDTRAGADADAGKKARDEQIAKIAAGGLAELLDAMPGKLLSASADDALKRRTRGLEVEDAAHVSAALVALRDRPDRTSALASIRVPTLVLVGADDGVTPRAESEIMVARIAGAELAVIEGAGHLANLQAPRAFEAAVLSFLDRAL